MPPKADRERIAIELKKWLRSQDHYKTIKDLQGPTGIPYESLKDYFQGRSIPSGDRLEKLSDLTGLSSLIELSPRRVSRTQKTSDSPGIGTSSSKEIAQSVFTTVHRLLNELNFFKRGTSADRSILRQVVPARDVGYLTTLFKAMYDEDQFQTWLYFTEYNPDSR